MSEDNIISLVSIKFFGKDRHTAMVYIDDDWNWDTNVVMQNALVDFDEHGNLLVSGELMERINPPREIFHENKNEFVNVEIEFYKRNVQYVDDSFVADKEVSVGFFNKKTYRYKRIFRPFLRPTGNRKKYIISNYVFDSIERL